jgi:hypothetical protein
MPDSAAIQLDKLSFDDRQAALAQLSEPDREAVIESLPNFIREKWVYEELEHLKGVVAEQPVEGADFGEPVQEVEIPGADAPQDRDTSVGAETIAALVQERIEAERKTAEVQRELAEAAAELDAYYQKFGPLNPED